MTLAQQMRIVTISCLREPDQVSARREASFGKELSFRGRRVDVGLEMHVSRALTVVTRDVGTFACRLANYVSMFAAIAGTAPSIIPWGVLSDQMGTRVETIGWHSRPGVVV